MVSTPRRLYRGMYRPCMGWLARLRAWWWRLTASPEERVAVLLREMTLDAEQRGHHMRNESPHPRIGVAICDRSECRGRIEVGYREGRGRQPVVLSDNASNSTCPAVG